MTDIAQLPSAQRTASPTRILIVDDDALARAHVVDALRGRTDYLVVSECGDADAAVHALELYRPDLVLLDVQMPGGDGFEVVSRVGVERMPPVVFASAYAEFAVRAFEACAVDYLLKPFDDTRLLTALDRGRVAARRGAPDGRLQALLDQLARADPPNAPPAAQYPDAIAVKVGDRYAVVRVADVDWIGVEGNYAELHVGGRTRVVARSLATLEREVLDPARFVRIHRSAIVNTARVASVEPAFHGDLVLVLGDGSKIDCSRRYRPRLEARLYFTT